MDLALTAQVRFCKVKAVASLLDSIHLIFGLPFLQLPSTIPSLIVFCKEPSLLTMCPWNVIFFMTCLPPSHQEEWYKPGIESVLVDFLLLADLGCLNVKNPYPHQFIFNIMAQKRLLCLLPLLGPESQLFSFNWPLGGAKGATPHCQKELDKMKVRNRKFLMIENCSLWMTMSSYFCSYATGFQPL